MDRAVTSDGGGEVAGDEAFTVTIKGEGLSLERSVSSSVALLVIQAVMGKPPIAWNTIAPPAAAAAAAAGNPAHVLGSQSGSSTTAAVPRQSIKNFIDDSGASAIASKIVAVGIYLRDVELQPEFTREDILTWLRNAREPAPTNLPRDVQTTIRNGWIAEDPRNKNHFFVTGAGDTALSSKFEGSRASSESVPELMTLARCGG